MTNKIDITGIIGIDTTYESIIQKLDQATGNLEFIINSVGGYVYDGIAIYNTIKKYNRGTKTMKVCGLSASIASYIMMAGDRLELEENSVVMIHNPSVGVMGDYRKLKTACNHIEKLRHLMSNSYSKYTGIAKEDIETMMDNETFFIGLEELKTWGTVIENPTDNNSNNRNSNDNNKLTKAEAEIQIQAMCSLVEKDAKERNKDTERLVAMLEELEPTENKSQPQQNKETPAETNSKLLTFTNKPKETKMEKLQSLEDFKTQYPKIYTEVINLGVQQEKSRVNAHLEFLDVAPETALNAIKENISFINNSEIQAKYLKSKLNKNEIATMQNDNNPELLPKKIDDGKELKNEDIKANLETEEKIKAFMPHLNTKPNNQ